MKGFMSQIRNLFSQDRQSIVEMKRIASKLSWPWVFHHGLVIGIEMYILFWVAFAEIFWKAILKVN